MTNFIHYLPLLFVACLFIKKPYFSWAWLANCLLLVIGTIAHDFESFKTILSFDITSIEPEVYFQSAFLLCLSFASPLTFKKLSKLAALASYFTCFYALELLHTSTWTEFIVHFELVTLFSALLVFSYNSYSSHKSAFSYMLTHVFAASLLIAGSLIAHDNALSHFNWHEHPIASYFIIFGLIVHAGLVPFHAWMLNSQKDADHNNKLLLHITLPLLACFALFQFFKGHFLLMYFGLGSALYASFFMIKQKSMRETSSYLFITLLGFIVASIGLNTDASIQVVLLFAVLCPAMTVSFIASVKTQFEEKTIDAFLQLKEKQEGIGFTSTYVWSALSFCLACMFLIMYFTLISKETAIQTGLHYPVVLAFSFQLFALAVKPFQLLTYKKEPKSLTGSKLYTLFFTVAIVLLSIYSCYILSQNYGIFKNIAGLQYGLVILIPILLLFIFKKMYGTYIETKPKDYFTLISIPDFSSDQNESRQRFFYTPRLPRPRIKLFYFESIENSVSYILAVFFIALLLFLSV